MNFLQVGEQITHMWYQSLRNLQMFHLLSGDLKPHHNIIFNACPTGSEIFRVSLFRLGLWSETTQATLPAVGMSPDHWDVQQVDAVKNEVDGISWIWRYLNHVFSWKLATRCEDICSKWNFLHRFAQHSKICVPRGASWGEGRYVEDMVFPTLGSKFGCKILMGACKMQMHRLRC